MMRLIDDIIAHSANNEFGVPIFGYHEWKDLCAEFAIDDELKPGLETILPAIQRFIDHTKPPLPIARPSYDDMVQSFHKLRKYDIRTTIDKSFTKNAVRNKFDEPVEITHIIKAGHNLNDVSNHFQCDNRYTCGYHTKPSNYEIWNDPFGAQFRSLMLYFWREFKSEQSPIDQHKYRAMFRLSGYVATQFKPLVAKSVYDYNNAKNVIDISCGWGDRLAGFYCSNAVDYLGCDPNTASYELYKKQCMEYEKLLSSPLFPVDIVFEDHGDWFEVRGNKRVRIYNRPAEDIDWKVVTGMQYDLMFTSPPYFGIERYAEGQSCEDKQSWKRYNEYDAWRDTFFYLVLDSMKEVCDNVMINIVDPVVKGKRYRVEDDIRSRYGIESIVGMKLAKRPSGQSDQKDQYRVDGEKLQFIEPIYKLV
jgi:hypothetical protein